MVYNRISQRVDVLEKITKLDKEVIENNVLSTLLCVGIGLLLAYIGKAMPTFINVWVNAIMFPCVQLLIIGLLVYGTLKK